MNLSNKKRAPKSEIPGKIQIIAGHWRGRKISVASSPGLRPTGSRVRETLFNWLVPYINGARCLDLFAGSGILSFEALSRGAKHCTALDNHHEAIKHLTNNGNLLGSNLNIVHTDAILYLSQKNLNTPYNLAFVDPPFTGTFHNEACTLLEENNWLTASAMVYCEISANSMDFSAPANWRLEKDKTTGDVRYMLYSRFETSN
jgi:16S rRNA (guanine966-N2)-methyltransferase